MHNIQKIKAVLIATIILLQFAGLAIAYYGFVDLSYKVSFIDGRLHRQLTQHLSKDNANDLDVLQFMKDLNVYVCLYGDCIMIFLAIGIVGLIVYIFLLKKSSVKIREVG